MERDWELHYAEFGHYRLQRVGVAGGIFFRKEEIENIVNTLLEFQDCGDISCQH